MSTTARTTPAAPGGIAAAILRFREVGIFLALVLLVVVTTLSNPRFLSTQSVRDLLLGASIMVILAVGQTLVIVTRNVDLSVGSILGLTAFGTGALFVAQPNLPIVVVIVVAMAFGAALGSINGALVTLARVPALVVTLGTLYAFRGVDFAWAGGRQINAADMPREFLDFGTGRLLGIPILALVALAVVLVAGWCLSNLRSGREFYAIGSDPDAARLVGIPAGRRIMFAFVANGALAGLGGALYAARFGTLDATAGTGLELEVVAAVVVGGVAIFGGSGTVYGAAIGAVLLTTIGSSLAVLRVNPFWQEAVVGVMIVGAIALERTLAARVARQLQGGGRDGS